MAMTSFTQEEQYMRDPHEGDLSNMADDPDDEWSVEKGAHPGLLGAAGILLTVVLFLFDHWSAVSNWLQYAWASK